MTDRQPVRPWPPEPGYYATRLVKGGPRVAVRIWFGSAIIDGEEQDRAPGWYCEIDGATTWSERDKDTGYECSVPFDAGRVWPFCAKDRIDEGEYRYLLAMATHAKEHETDHPAATPRERIDVRQMAPIF